MSKWSSYSEHQLLTEGWREWSKKNPEDPDFKIVYGINSEDNPDSLTRILRSLDLDEKVKEAIISLMLLRAKEDNVVLEQLGAPQRGARAFSPETTRELSKIIGDLKDKDKVIGALHRWAKLNTVKFTPAALAAKPAAKKTSAAKKAPKTTAKTTAKTAADLPDNRRPPAAYASYTAAVSSAPKARTKKIDFSAIEKAVNKKFPPSGANGDVTLTNPSSVLRVVKVEIDKQENSLRENNKTQAQEQLNEAIITGALLAKLIFFLSQKENIGKMIDALLTRDELPPSMRKILEEIKNVIEVVDKELPFAVKAAIQLRAKAPDSWVGNLLVSVLSRYIKKDKKSLLSRFRKKDKKSLTSDKSESIDRRKNEKE